MDSLMGRSQFLSETANLFTDEKTATARAKVVEWVNEMAMADSMEKCQILVKVQETILGSCVELLEEFLEPIMALSHDSNMDVRKQLVGFIEQICKVKVDLLPQFISVVPMLLRDRSPQVIKRAIQASGSIYKNGLQWICGHEELTDSVEQSWNMLNLVKAQILDLIDNDNDGIRTNAIKFLEGVVVLQSYPDEDSQKKDNDFSLEDVPEKLKIIRRKKLEEEAFNIFDILLKFHAATHISSVNLIACTGSLCTIAKLRTSLMGPVVDAFKHLNSNLPPTLTDSQVSSVRKSLKMQLMALLKNRGSFEFQSVIRHLLLDLGASSNEIQRATPKMDKVEHMRRQKRILESSSSAVSKKVRLDDDDDDSGSGDIGDVSGSGVVPKKPPAQQRMVIDEEELEKQRQKSTRVNEKFIAEHIRSPDLAVNLIVKFLPYLPSQPSAGFLNEYTPVRDMTIQQIIGKISRSLGEQMTAEKLGPGSAAFSKLPPMRPATDDKEEPMDTTEEPAAANICSEEEQQRKDEATKKLRENMERLKGEQELIERMKMRAKTLKLQEITKPFARPVKEKFLADAVKRILQAERSCTVGGVSSKRRKILTVMAATFPETVRVQIFDFIMMDIKHRIDLAFSWLFEEYSLMQGYTRHSYVKSEHRPDYAYTELLNKLIEGIRKRSELKERILLLRRVYLEAPLLPEDAIKALVAMCRGEENSQYTLDLMKDLALMRPPRKTKFLKLLLGFCVHERPELRERALEHIVLLYNVHNILPNRIEEFALEWAMHLEKETPPPGIFGEEWGRPDVEVVWKDETTRICLVVMLTLLPYKPEYFLDKLCGLFVATSAILKRSILRSIDGCVKKLGPANAVLLKFIEDCPKGAETLIIRIIYILTEREHSAHPELLQRVRFLYASKVKDVRVLIPVLNGLSRSEIINALPKFLKLNPAIVKEVFNRLLAIGPEFSNFSIAATPTDILVALHTIDVNDCDLKSIVKATSLCLAEKEVFTYEVLVGVLQQLIELVPLPTLLMRTIIQSLTIYPRLSGFVLNLLQRLILKQVWRQKVIWEGFLKCLQRLKPQSLPVMLHLPQQQLVAALQQCPDLRGPLQEYAESIQEEPMSGITQQIMDIISGKTVDVFVTDETGGYISIDNIKKEVEDVQEGGSFIASVSQKGSLDAGQPLPPGED